MLLPNKHIRLGESLLGLGSFILTQCKEPLTLDSIWYKLGEAYDTGAFPSYHSFDNLLAASAFLYSIGALAETNDGKLYKCG